MAMNPHEAFEYHPKVDRLAEYASGQINTSQIRLFYESESDILLFYLIYTDLAISHEITDNIYLLLDPETEDVVGFQFDDYLHTVVVENPKLLDLAPFAGISPEMIEEAKARIGEDRLRSSVFRQTVQDLKETTFR